MGKLKSYSGSLFEERGLVINLKLYTGGGAHKREREGGLVRNYQSCGFRRKGSIFLTFPLKKKKKDVSIALRKLSKTYLTTWLSTLTELTTYIQFQS